MSVNSFLATTGHGLARASRSASDTWSVEVLLIEQDVRCLAADLLNRDIIYAGTQGNGVLRSDDGGKTWRSVGLAGQIVKALAISRTQPGTVYAGTKPAPSSSSMIPRKAVRIVPDNAPMLTHERGKEGTITGLADP